MKRSLNDRIWDKIMSILDPIDSKLVPIAGCFAGIGLCACIIGGISLITHLVGDKKFNIEGQDLIISAQITEVADDGVLSHIRKYHCKNIERAESNYIRLKDAKDDFGHNYERVIIQNVPYVIEQTVEAK